MTEPEAAVAPRSILIVDDEPSNLHLLSRILRSEGYHVRVATSGAQALQEIAAISPDLVLLDVMMPDMSGFEVCDRLKADAKTEEIPVLFLSALDDVEDKLKAFRAGAADYITKPFHAREVMARVATHQSLRTLQQELKAANQALAERNLELERRNAELQEALNTIRTLSGLIPICGWCGRKIEDQDGEWVPVEVYIEARSEASFTHGMCPDCFNRARDEAAQARRERRPIAAPDA